MVDDKYILTVKFRITGRIRSISFDNLTDAEYTYKTFIIYHSTYFEWLKITWGDTIIHEQIIEKGDNNNGT